MITQKLKTHLLNAQQFQWTFLPNFLLIKHTKTLPAAKFENFIRLAMVKLQLFFTWATNRTSHYHDIRHPSHPRSRKRKAVWRMLRPSACSESDTSISHLCVVCRPDHVQWKGKLLCLVWSFYVLDISVIALNFQRTQFYAVKCVREPQTRSRQIAYHSWLI